MIRSCLREACTELEARHTDAGLHCVLDEATRGKSGSPNIPQTIFEKISAADVFVCDLTTINPSRHEGERPTPNPNVAIELGYAIAYLGWERIVMLVNESFCSKEELPFDVQVNRASGYSFCLPLADEENMTNRQKRKAIEFMKTDLRALLTNALESIWTQRPMLPADSADIPPETVKRKRDATMLSDILSTIHIPTMDAFLEEIQIGQLPVESLYFWHGFDGLVTSSFFYLNDKTAKKLVLEFHANWNRSMSFSYYSRMNAGATKCILRPDMPLQDNEEKQWQAAIVAGGEAKRLFAQLIRHVRENYVEIDIDQTSEAAWRDFVEYEEKIGKRFG